VNTDSAQKRPKSSPPKREPPGTDDPSRRRFRNMLGQFATGVAVITTLDEGGAQLGVTCNSFTSVSLDPPLILWSIAKSSLSGPAFTNGKAFAVNVLEASQEDLAMRFAKTGADKFAGVPWHKGLEGVPLLEGCVAYMECRVDARYPGGDHEIILGAVERYVNLALDPLLFHSGEFRNFS
jgi:flavin reductase (DIM6/NTAB) family NADH-FMN oxidoreductase RutF